MIQYIIKTFVNKYFVKIWKYIFGREPQKLPDNSVSDVIVDNLQAEGINIKKSWWNDFIDGVNRLPRPIGTFGVYGLIGIAVFSPDKYASVMVALSGTPELMFVIYLTIIGFWFGGKIIQQYKTKDLIQSMKNNKVSKKEKPKIETEKEIE